MSLVPDLAPRTASRATLTRFAPGPLFFALVVGLFAGCEEVKKGAESEQKIADEQAIILAYTAKVPDVDQKLAAFLAAWERANEQRDLKALKDDLTANVKPAIAAHIDALAAMPTGSPELTAIHAPLVAAYRGAAAAFDTFLAAVTEDTLDAEYTRLLSAMEQVTAAEDAYHKALGAHCAKHRLTLTAPAPAPSAP